MPVEIFVDAMGSDKAPESEIRGAILASRTLDVHVLDLVIQRRKFITHNISIGHDECLVGECIGIEMIFHIRVKHDRQKIKHTEQREEFHAILHEWKIIWGRPALAIPNSTRQYKEKNDELQSSGKEK